MSYSPEVIEHLVNPCDEGEIPTPDGAGESGDAACGDVVSFALRVEDGRVAEVSYRVYGCAACIAASSALSGLVEGRDLLEAASVSATDLEESLGGPLPEGKGHGVVLALDALHGAFEDYWNRSCGEALLRGYRGDGQAEKKENAVVVATSGGVDSAVTALLLKREGYEVVCVTFRLHDAEPGSNSCCSPDTVLFARETAHRMGLAHFTLDLQTLFERRVMQDFTGSYARGRTPNPCVMCNAHVKFHAVAAVADTLGFERIATGHYARVVEGPALARAADPEKDQTYVLWPVPKEMLARTVFPLGELYSKDETRHMAEENGLAVASTPESQDICFIPDGDYRGFVRRHVSSSPGDIVDGEGNRLGEHSGITEYTVGQRRGLGISSNSGPLYVRELRPQSNQVVVGHKEELLVDRVRVGGMNWFRAPEEATSVQLRYRSAPVPCTVETEGRSGCVAHLDEPVTKAAPGQSAVFYDGDTMVGGGMVLKERDGNGRMV